MSQALEPRGDFESDKKIFLTFICNIMTFIYKLEMSLSPEVDVIILFVIDFLTSSNFSYIL